MIFNIKETLDAKTLDGHGASYFADKEAVKNNALWHELTSGFDLNNALGKYNSMRSAIVSSLLNKPSGVSGEITVEWYPSDNTDGKYGMQILRHTSKNLAELYFRFRYNVTWGEWQKVFTMAGGTVEVNTFNGMRVKRLSDKEQWYAGIMFANNNGDLCGVASDGNGDLLKMDKSGNLVGFLLHTDNMAKHVLPLTGGTITRDGSSPIELKNKSDNLSMVKFSGSGGALGWLGFDSVDKPIFRSTGAVYNDLLHTGNSAKTVISNTAPSDTTALWIDTSA